MLAKPTQVKTAAPTKRRNTFKFEVTFEIPEEVFTSSEVVVKFGTLGILGFSPEFVSDKFKNNSV